MNFEAKYIAIKDLLCGIQDENSSESYPTEPLHNFNINSMSAEEIVAIQEHFLEMESYDIKNTIQDYCDHYTEILARDARPSKYSFAPPFRSAQFEPILNKDFEELLVKFYHQPPELASTSNSDIKAASDRVEHSSVSDDIAATAKGCSDAVLKLASAWLDKLDDCHCVDTLRSGKTARELADITCLGPNTPVSDKPTKKKKSKVPKEKEQLDAAPVQICEVAMNDETVVLENPGEETKENLEEILEQSDVNQDTIIVKDEIEAGAERSEKEVMVEDDMEMIEVNEVIEEVFMDVDEGRMDNTDVSALADKPKEDVEMSSPIVNSANSSPVSDEPSSPVIAPIKGVGDEATTSTNVPSNTTTAKKNTSNKWLSYNVNKIGRGHIRPSDCLMAILLDMRASMLPPTRSKTHHPGTQNCAFLPPYLTPADVLANVAPMGQWTSPLLGGQPNVFEVEKQLQGVTEIMPVNTDSATDTNSADMGICESKPSVTGDSTAAKKGYFDKPIGRTATAAASQCSQQFKDRISSFDAQWQSTLMETSVEKWKKVWEVSTQFRCSLVDDEKDATSSWMKESNLREDIRLNIIPTAADAISNPFHSHRSVKSVAQWEELLEAAVPLTSKDECLHPSSLYVNNSSTPLSITNGYDKDQSKGVVVNEHENKSIFRFLTISKSTAILMKGYNLILLDKEIADLETKRPKTRYEKVVGRATLLADVLLEVLKEATVSALSAEYAPDGKPVKKRTKKVEKPSADGQSSSQESVSVSMEVLDGNVGNSQQSNSSNRNKECEGSEQKSKEAAAAPVSAGTSPVRWGPHLLVVSALDVEAWVATLTAVVAREAPHVQIIPYFGSATDRVHFRTLVGQDYMFSQRGQAFIFVTHYAALSDDIEFFHTIPCWHSLILDEPFGILSNCKYALYQRSLYDIFCRQRILVASSLTIPTEGDGGQNNLVLPPQSEGQTLSPLSAVASILSVSEFLFPAALELIQQSIEDITGSYVLTPAEYAAVITGVLGGSYAAGNVASFADRTLEGDAFDQSESAINNRMELDHVCWHHLRLLMQSLTVVNCDVLCANEKEVEQKHGMVSMVEQLSHRFGSPAEVIDVLAAAEWSNIQVSISRSPPTTAHVATPDANCTVLKEEGRTDPVVLPIASCYLRFFKAEKDCVEEGNAPDKDGQQVILDNYFNRTYIDRELDKELKSGFGGSSSLLNDGGSTLSSMLWQRHIDEHVDHTMHQYKLRGVGIEEENVDAGSSAVSNTLATGSNAGDLKASSSKKGKGKESIESTASVLETDATVAPGTDAAAKKHPGRPPGPNAGAPRVRIRKRKAQSEEAGPGGGGDTEPVKDVGSEEKKKRKRRSSAEVAAANAAALIAKHEAEEARKIEQAQVAERKAEAAIEAKLKKQKAAAAAKLAAKEKEREEKAAERQAKSGPKASKVPKAPVEAAPPVLASMVTYTEEELKAKQATKDEKARQDYENEKKCMIIRLGGLHQVWIMNSSAGRLRYLGLFPFEKNAAQAFHVAHLQRHEQILQDLQSVQDGAKLSVITPSSERKKNQYTKKLAPDHFSCVGMSDERIMSRISEMNAPHSIVLHNRPGGLWDAPEVSPGAYAILLGSSNFVAHITSLNNILGRASDECVDFMKKVLLDYELPTSVHKGPLVVRSTSALAVEPTSPKEASAGGASSPSSMRGMMGNTASTGQQPSLNKELSIDNMVSQAPVDKFGPCDGLPAHGIDVHLGDDCSIDRKHAAIVWNTEAAVFELECLSATKCVYVNGESYDNVKGVAANTIFPSTDGTSMKPYMSLGHVKIPIYSKDVIQVGSRIFHFLLAALSSNKRQHLEHPYEQRRDIVRSLQSTFPMRQTLCKDDEDAWEYSNMMQDKCLSNTPSMLLDQIRPNPNHNPNNPAVTNMQQQTGKNSSASAPSSGVGSNINSSIPAAQSQAPYRPPASITKTSTSIKSNSTILNASPLYPKNYNGLPPGADATAGATTLFPRPFLTTPLPSPFSVPGGTAAAGGVNSLVSNPLPFTQQPQPSALYLLQSGGKGVVPPVPMQSSLPPQAGVLPPSIAPAAVADPSAPSNPPMPNMQSRNHLSPKEP